MCPTLVVGKEARFNNHMFWFQQVDLGKFLETDQYKEPAKDQDQEPRNKSEKHLDLIQDSDPLLNRG